MRVLALDTTTREGSIAIVEATAERNEVRFVSNGDATRSHAERLPGDLLAAVQALGLSTADIDLFAVVAGPGSFTGLRIGIAAMQGLAVVHRRPMVPVSALLALAMAATEAVPAGALAGAWMDAHRGDVFSGLWRVTGAPRFTPDHMVELDPARVGPPAATLARWTSEGHAPAVIVGDGATAYSAIVGETARVVDAPALAPIAGLMAIAVAGTGAIHPAAVQPIYVRRPDAEVARDAMLQRGHDNGGPAS